MTRKLNIYLILLFAFLFAMINPGCIDSDDAGKFVGRWEWISSVGGYTGGQTVTPESTGHTSSLMFDKNGKFVSYSDGVAKNSGSYKLKMGKTPFSTKPKPIVGLFIEGNEDPIEYVYRFEDSNTLILVDNSTDAYGHTYRRVSS